MSRIRNTDLDYLKSKGIFTPAESLEEDVVALGAKLNPPEKAHGSVAPLRILEHDRVEILHRDPPEKEKYKKMYRLLS
jgi:hypothetical protein